MSGVSLSSAGMFLYKSNRIEGSTSNSVLAVAVAVVLLISGSSKK